MKKYISLGKFDSKYFLIYILYFFIIVFLATSLITSGKKNYDNPEANNNNKSNISYYNNSGTNSSNTLDTDLSKYYDFNILLILLINYFSQSLLFILAFLIDKLIFKKNNENEIPKKAQKMQIEFIFNDLSKKIKIRDYAYIMATSILLLLIDFSKIFIFIKVLTLKKSDGFNFSGESSLFELICLLLISFFFYKIKFYKHQYFSIFILISVELFKYLYRINYKFPLQNFLFLFSQLLISFSDSFIIVYTKALMVNKFLSPLKATYLFGIICIILVIIIYIITTFIPCKSSICNIEYNGQNYFDNFFSIFSSSRYEKAIQKICFFFLCILFGPSRLIINIITYKYTVCHLFLFIQIKEIIFSLADNIIFANYPFENLTDIIAVFANLVLLEFIELNFFGLEKNIKKNIQDRAEDEYDKALLLGAIKNENDNLSDEEVDENEKKEE